jgi:uncharacterized OsmC-like protein
MRQAKEPVVEIKAKKSQKFSKKRCRDGIIKKKKHVTPRKSQLGSLLGCSVVSVIRAMGKAGWDYETARAALNNARIRPATHTVKIGLKRGRDGQKRIAPLTKAQLNTLRVK